MTNEERIREAYDAFNTRDADPAIALMACDVEWPDVADGGFVHGREAVREHWLKQFRTADPRIEPLAFRERPDGRVAVEVRQTASAAGRRRSDELVHVYAFRDGLIARMDIAGSEGG